jgi:hypothetical protein
MQRRNVSADKDGSQMTTSKGSVLPSSSATPPRNRAAPATTSATAGGVRPPGKLLNNCVLLVIALVLTIATYLIPEGSESASAKLITAENRVIEAEERLLQSVVDAEGAVQHWLYDSGKPNAATQRMLQQGSKWVDGEKKLKTKLKELAALQAQGKELGVPVATRWLGDDIPAWAGAGVDVADWQKRVDARYAEMRSEEERWIEMVSATLDAKRG